MSGSTRVSRYQKGKQYKIREGKRKLSAFYTSANTIIGINVLWIKPHKNRFCSSVPSGEQNLGSQKHKKHVIETNSAPIRRDAPTGWSLWIWRWRNHPRLCQLVQELRSSDTKSILHKLVWSPLQSVRITALHYDVDIPAVRALLNDTMWPQ